MTAKHITAPGCTVGFTREEIKAIRANVVARQDHSRRFKHAQINANRLLDLLAIAELVPELLEALQVAEQKLVELEHAVGGGDGEIYVEGAILTARAAIAKATGEAQP